MKKTSLLLVFSLIALGFLVILNSCKKDEENKNPVVSSVIVNPASINAGGMVTVTVSASDPDGDALSYSYTATGGAIQGSGSTATWTAPNQAGAYSVTVAVSDGNGGAASGSGTLTVTQVQQQTKVTGTAQFPAGTSGDLSNAKVSLYTSYENWNANQPIKFGAVTGAGASVTFELMDVLPGNYYLDVWKDIDNNAFWSSGDYVGWYGTGGLGSPSLTEFQIGSGQTFNCSVNMYIIAKGSNIPK
ncbi:MAG TPA: PKD domain-containing protein [Bacteroidales bacterium]|nr:PKD domain-containing protein [Bacteroidales bacterium]